MIDTSLALHRALLFAFLIHSFRSCAVWWDEHYARLHSAESKTEAFRGPITYPRSQSRAVATGKRRGENWQRKQITKNSASNVAVTAFQWAILKLLLHCLVTKEQAQQARLVTVRTVTDQPMGRELLAGPKLNFRLVVENEVCFTPSQTHIRKSESLWAVFEQGLRSTVENVKWGVLAFTLRSSGHPDSISSCSKRHKSGRLTLDLCYFPRLATLPLWSALLFKSFLDSVFLPPSLAPSLPPSLPLSFSLGKCLNLKALPRTQVIFQLSRIKWSQVAGCHQGQPLFGWNFNLFRGSCVAYLFLYIPVTENVLTWRSVHKEL